MTVDEALAYAEHHANVILGGERESLLIPGFHLGNSPLEYTSERVKGKTVVLTTTNGTNAIRRAAQGAARVIIASFLNARSVAKEVLKTGSDVVLICAGTRGKLAGGYCSGGQGLPGTGKNSRRKGGLGSRVGSSGSCLPAG